LSDTDPSRIGPADIRSLSRRPPDARKGQGGRVLIVGGSVFFRGALVYAARAAAQIADLVYHCAPAPCRAAIDQQPDLLGTCLDGDYLHAGHLDDVLRRVEAYRIDAVLIGPGMGLGPEAGVPEGTRDLVARLIPRLADRKVVVDADGLNALAGRLDVLGPHVCLTPHRGEFAKLSGVDPTSEHVVAFAKARRAVVVLKGPVDVVTDGERTRYNHTGNPGMATGGTGDVLSGALAGLAARNDLFHAACAAAYLTGLAGDLVMETRGEFFTASDVVDMLGGAAMRADETDEE
jgi:NAD(P)H-hydrate epimerase